MGELRIEGQDVENLCGCNERLDHFRVWPGQRWSAADKRRAVFELRADLRASSVVGVEVKNSFVTHAKVATIEQCHGELRTVAGAVDQIEKLRAPDMRGVVSHQGDIGLLPVPAR
jgi:hypothetical protein